MITLPVSPSTRIRCPVLIRLVPTAVPVTAEASGAGIPGPGLGVRPARNPALVKNAENVTPNRDASARAGVRGQPEQAVDGRRTGWQTFPSHRR